MNQHDFENLLGSVLQEDAQVEPLSHLEERVLQHLDRRQATEKRRAPFFWVFGALAASGVLLLALPLYHAPAGGGENRGRVTSNASASASETVRSVTLPSPEIRTASRRVVHLTQQRENPVSAEPSSALPKQDVFPAPSSPSEPERELAGLKKQAVTISGLDDVGLRGKAPAPLVVPPIQIAAIKIEPLIPLSDTQKHKSPAQ